MRRFFHNTIVKIFVVIIVIAGFLFFQNDAEATITYQTPGATAYSASGGTSVSPAYPANVSANNLLVLVIGMKPSTANSGSVTTPTGWTPISSLTGAGGYGTTLGADTGNTNVFTYYKVASGTETGTLAVTIATNNVSWARMFRFSNATGSWSIAGATGSDTTGNTTVSVAHSTNPGVTAGDYILGAMVIPTDISTPSQFSLEALSQTGVTFGTVTEVSEPDTNVGNDVGGVIYSAPVSAGTASGAPTFTATAGGTTTNVRGPGVFIRVRESNTTPTLSISQPDGVSDTITVGALYNITYTLADPDPLHAVTTAFYYDTDATGLNGTAITGACATATEGTNATCSWNTTGVTPGSYYIYGLTSDGIAPQVSMYSTGVITINPIPITTISDGTNPSNTAIAPGAGATDLDTFNFTTNTGIDSVTAVTVTLAPANAFTSIAQVDITDNSNVARCTAVANPASNTISFTTCASNGGVSVGTSPTAYKVRITPKSHANMPAVPGASYATTGTVTSFTSSNSQAGTDGASGTVTIDNLSPNSATSVGGIAGDTKVTLNWTSSNSADFNTTSGSVIYRWTGGSIGTEVPAEGSAPTAGNVNGTATVACVISSTVSTALSRIDGTGGSAGCTTTALVNGQSYAYKVFQKDVNGNYDTGVLVGTFTPSPTPTTTLGTGSDPSANSVAPEGGATDVNYFTLQTNTGTETVSSVTMNLSTNNGVALLTITDTSNVVLGSTASPTTGLNTISVSGMLAGTSLSVFKVRATPHTHVGMPAVPGGAYAVTAPVTTWVGSFAHTGSDTNSSALTIDNLSPSGTTNINASSDNAQVTVSWTNPSDSDFQKVIIYCKTSSINEAPTEGNDPAVDGVACNGTARIKYSGTASPQTFTGLTNGLTYYYRIYARDSNGNFTNVTATEQTSATPSVTTFPITATSGTNGDVTPSGITNVAQGGSQAYSITPSTGYDVATLVVDSVSIATSTSHTFTNVQGPHTISATFAPLPTPPTTFTITASAGANGTTTPSGVTVVTQGGSQAYSITPDAGYDVADLLINGGSVATSTSYTFTNVQATSTIHATFILLPTPPVTHTITSSAGGGGSIDPLGATIVADGASQSYTITPDSGFTIETLIVDSVSIATSTTHTFTNVTTDHTISATFALIPPPLGSFTIVATSGLHGSIIPSGSTVVAEHGSQIYTITPDSGYDVGTLLIDSFAVSTSTSHTFTDVTANHTIEATFVALPGAETPAPRVRRLASIIFSGKAFPGGKISIIRKELSTETIISREDTTYQDGSFQIKFDDLPIGAHSFGLLIKDIEGRSSQTKFFFMDANRGDEVFKDIVAPPTLDIVNGQVSRGKNVVIFGYASPSHTIRVYLNDILYSEVLAGRGGVYSFELPTGALGFGQHKIRTKQINLDTVRESDFSTSRTFIVSKLAVVKADLSGDGKIDIKDWSIFLARWGAKSSLGRVGIDLNSDGKVDITDFSIFIKTVRRK